MHLRGKLHVMKVTIALAVAIAAGMLYTELKPSPKPTPEVLAYRAQLAEQKEKEAHALGEYYRRRCKELYLTPVSRMTPMDQDDWGVCQRLMNR